jgi:hypothetical protein
VNLKILRADTEGIARAEGVCCGDGHPYCPFGWEMNFYDNRNRDFPRNAIMAA